MKRLCAALLCVCLLLPFAVVGVAEEPAVNILSAGWQVKPGTTFVVTWDNPLATLKEMDIGEILAIQAGDMEVDGTTATITFAPGQLDAPLGEHNVNYSFEVADEEPSSEPPAVVPVYAPNGYLLPTAYDVSIAIEFVEGSTQSAIHASVIDSLGFPVEGVTLKLGIGATHKIESQMTDHEGKVVFTLGVRNSDEDVLVRVDFEGAEIEGITYRTNYAEKVAHETEAPPTTTTTTTSDTTTSTQKSTSTTVMLPTLPTGGTTGTVPTVPTQGTVRGDTSTGVANGHILMNVITDSDLLPLFGGSMDVFNGKARVRVSSADYAKLIGTYGGTGIGGFYASALSPTAEQIEATRQGSENFADCAGLTMQSLTFRLAMEFLSESGMELHIDDTSSVGSVMYTVELPVPVSMRNCTIFGVAMTGAESMTALTRVTARGGVITFTAPALGNFTVVGYEGSVEVANQEETGSPLLTLFIVLLVVGVLLLIGCGVMIYLFFLRARKAAPAASGADDAYAEEEFGGLVLGDVSARETPDTPDTGDTTLTSGESLLPPDEKKPDSGRRIVGPDDLFPGNM